MPESDQSRSLGTAVAGIPSKIWASVLHLRNSADNLLFCIDAVVSGGLPVNHKKDDFVQNHEQVSLFMVLFGNDDNVPVLSTQWTFGSNGFLATFSHFSLCLIGGPTFYVPPNARPTKV